MRRAPVWNDILEATPLDATRLDDACVRWRTASARMANLQRILLSGRFGYIEVN